MYSYRKASMNLHFMTYKLYLRSSFSRKKGEFSSRGVDLRVSYVEVMSVAVVNNEISERRRLKVSLDDAFVDKAGE